MSEKKSGDKGLKTEELLRSYFLRAGFFVLRGVPFRQKGNDLTDIDLWVYERSATLSRRRIIIDIKDKARPQAAERIFFVQGLARTLGVEGAGIATSDNRSDLAEFARKSGLLFLDGGDLQRLKSNTDLQNESRLSEENLLADIAAADRARGSQQFNHSYDGMKAAVADRFGSPSANYALESASIVARECSAAHPNSATARLAGRLTYMAASVAAAGFDFASADSILRPATERMRLFTEMIRFGTDASGTMARLQWAEQAIREYAANGAGVAEVVRKKFLDDLSRIPAEALAEVVVRQSKNDTLFNIARDLERAAFATDLPTFDSLGLEAKAFLGAVLDFVGVDRVSFAKAWEPGSPPKAGLGDKPDGALI